MTTILLQKDSETDLIVKLFHPSRKVWREITFDRDNDEYIVFGVATNEVSLNSYKDKKRLDLIYKKLLELKELL